MINRVAVKSWSSPGYAIEITSPLCIEGEGSVTGLADREDLGGNDASLPKFFGSEMSIAVTESIIIVYFTIYIYIIHKQALAIFTFTQASRCLIYSFPLTFPN